MGHDKVCKNVNVLKCGCKSNAPQKSVKNRGEKLRGKLT